jgi:hypothetical protein
MATANLDDFRRDARSAIPTPLDPFPDSGCRHGHPPSPRRGLALHRHAGGGNVCGMAFSHRRVRRTRGIVDDTERAGVRMYLDRRGAGDPHRRLSGVAAGCHAFCEDQHDNVLGWTGCFRVGLGMLLSSPANAKQRNRQQPAYGDQSYSGGVTVMPRNTPRANVVCWTSAGSHCDGRGSRSVHSPAASARRGWLLWRQQVGRSSLELRADNRSSGSAPRQAPVQSAMSELRKGGTALPHAARAGIHNHRQY